MGKKSPVAAGPCEASERKPTAPCLRKACARSTKQCRKERADVRKGNTSLGRPVEATKDHEREGPKNEGGA